MSEPMVDTLSSWDIVVVTYNSARALAEVWGTVPEDVRARVICVDNSSTDNTVAVAESLFPTVLHSPNRGLSVANNLGAAAGSADYILFANPDLAPEAHDFARLAAHLDSHGGLVSPRLVGDDKSVQENARGWPVLRAQVANRVSKSRAHAYRWPLPPGEDGPVPWILGAAVAVRREEATRIGGWPENYFLYYEDVVLCMRAWKAGSPVWLLGSIQWRHQWARSSRSLFGRSTRLHVRSALRFFASSPTFLLRVPGLLRRRFAAESARADQQRTWRAVDLVVRSDAETKHGGDLVQAQRCRDELERIGVDARIVPFSLDYTPRPDAIVHLFNVDRPWEFLYLARRVAPERLVVSTIHHSHALTRQMRRAEAQGTGRDAIVARLPERVREALLFALRSLSAKNTPASRRVAAALWALSHSVVGRPKRVGRTLERCRAVCLLSHRERADLEKDTGYRGTNHVLVPNGLEIGMPSGLDWHDRDPRILVVARVEPRKRQVEIAEAANRLGIALTFVGAANEKRDEYAKRLQTTLADGPSEWLGALTHEQVLELMGRSRVLLNLSWLEVQSLVDLEAAAMGCALVVSAAGSTSEWLGDAASEYPVGELDDALMQAQRRAYDESAPPRITYAQSWASAARQLEQIYANS